MKYMQVLSARHDTNSNRIEVIKEITNDDDTTELSIHTFSVDTLEWWSAIYNTRDLDEIIDFVIYEPYVESINPMCLSADEARQIHSRNVSQAKARLYKNGTANNSVTKNTIVSGTNLVSRALAKQLLLNARMDNKYILAADEDPGEVIRRCCNFDSEVIDIQREHIEHIRQSFNVERDEPNLDYSRAEIMKRQLRTERQQTDDIVSSNHVEQVPPKKPSGMLPTIHLVNGKRVQNDA